MRYAKVKYKRDTFCGIVNTLTDYVTRIEGDIFGIHDVTNMKYSVKELTFLAPVDPPDIIAVGLNYRQHAIETGAEIPKEPVIFLKASSSIANPDSSILLPATAPDFVDYEGELAIIIGKKASHVSEEDALDYVFGFTCGNDVSARDCQFKRDIQWARAKSFDTFCPLGPWMETEFNHANARIKTLLNGQIMQQSDISDMIFPVGKLVSYISDSMTLLPGTVIMTGTPPGVGHARKPPVFLRHGDVVDVCIEGIGVLRNNVKAVKL